MNVRTANVVQNVAHLPHLAIFDATDSIASKNPKWYAMSVMTIAMIPVATTLRNRYSERCFADERTTARLARRSRNRVHRCALRNRYCRRRSSRCNRNRKVLRERLLLRAVATSVAWHVGDDALYVNRRDVLPRAYRCERTQGESRSEYGSGLRARLLAKSLRNVYLKEIRRSRRTCRQYRRNDSRLNLVAIHINNSIVIFATYFSFISSSAPAALGSGMIFCGGNRTACISLTIS